jgi:UDP-glucose 4-epimerase
VGTIAITGGGGFLGQSAANWARAYGHNVIVFDRTEGDDVLGSLEKMESADSIIHLAGKLGTAELFDDAESAVEVNIIGALRVLQLCERTGAGFVNISMPPVFPSVYTATKVCTDRLATAWHLFKGVPTSKVIAYNAYGGKQHHGPGHPQKILPTFATLGWQNQPLPIWGDGEQTIDLVHADDVGRMLVEATYHGDDVTFDGGTGIAMTVNELADRIIDYTGSTAGKLYLPMRDGEVPTHIVAEERGWDRLDWHPELDWERVFEAVEAYRV